MIGEQLGSWIIDQEIGRGGMGVVYLAHRAGSPAEGPDLAALKVLASELSTETGFLQRFQREIEILGRLDHPGIVRLLESGEAGGHYFFAMEYVPGTSLQEAIEQRRRLPWTEVVEIGLQVAPALKHAHDRGIIHRDIKPSNLLLEGTRTATELSAPVVKLTDFGIARVFASEHLTVTGGVVGTAEYLSPEQAAGKPVSARSDLYALGVVLYTLLTGRTPFSGEPVDLLHKHLYAQPEHPCRVIPSLPHQLGDLICQLLAKDPAQRPSDGYVLLRRLEAFQRRQQLRSELAEREREDLGLGGASTPNEGEESLPGPATLMSRLMREELESQNRGGPLRRMLGHPVILLLLLIGCLTGIAWAFWPLGQDELYRRGAALMGAEDPDSWDEAWDRYLGPLERDHPGHPYRAELEQLRRKYESAQARRRAARAARSAGPMSEAEWFYHQALRYRQQGQEARAQDIWRALVGVFDSVPSEEPWVRLSRQRLEEHGAESEVARQWEPVAEASRQADRLRQEGEEEKAEAILRGLRTLYREDPQKPPALLNP